MNQHNEILAHVLSHRLCPACRRGYMGRRQRLKSACPNPACGPRENVLRMIRPTGHSDRGRWLSPSAPPSLTVRIVEYERVPFRLGNVVVSTPPDESANLWMWRERKLS